MQKNVNTDHMFCAVIKENLSKVLCIPDGEYEKNIALNCHTRLGVINSLV